MIRNTGFVTLLCVLVALISGCGGGGHSTSSVTQGYGSATFYVEWPRKTRMIPEAADYINLEIWEGDRLVKSRILTPTDEGQQQGITFDYLLAGNYTITANAYTQIMLPTGTPDSSINDKVTVKSENLTYESVPVATASAPLLIHANQNTPITLTLASTIDHIELSVPSTNLAAGQTFRVTPAAKDAQARWVMLSANKLQWTSSNTSKATVSSDGNVTGVSPGEVEITVTDTESGKSASVTITIT